jgi:copper transport protein
VAALLQVVSRAVALVAVWLGLAGAAHGHAVVLDTSPADGAVLKLAPGQIVIRFNEPVTPVSAQVLDAEGRNITLRNAVTVTDHELRIALPPSLAEGSYIASYRVVSADSHPVGGSIVFSVGRVSSRFSPRPTATGDWGWTVATIAVRIALYGGILFGAGGVLFLFLVTPEGTTERETTRMAAAVAALGSFAALLAIGIQGGLLLGGPISNLATSSAWRLGLVSGFGATAVTAMLGLALVAAGLSRKRPSVLRPLASLGAATTLTSLALSGHVITAGPRWVTVPVLLAHVIPISFWVGALVPLHQAVGRLGAEAAPVVERFSRVAFRAVPLLLAAGLVIAIVQVRSPRGLIGTTYGLFLLAKIGLVAGLLGLAALNKRRLTPSLARGDPRAGTALRRSIAAEIGLVLFILAATAALSTAPPPRVFASGSGGHADHPSGDPDAGLSVTIVTSGRSAEIILHSVRSGINSAQLKLLDSAGAAVQAQEVTFIAANPAAGVEPIRRTGDEAGPGLWRVEDLLLVPAGMWSIRIDALVSDFEKAQFETVIELR